MAMGIVNVPSSGAGTRMASLTLTSNGSTVINYDGTAPVTASVEELLGEDYMAALKNADNFKTIEENVGNIALLLAAQGMYPDFNALTYGIFGQANSDIDEFMVKVVHAEAGDSLIRVANIAKLIIGANYIISDGDSAEEIQVSSCVKENGIYSIVTSEALANNYNISKTYLYRTTVEISNGKAEMANVSGSGIWNLKTVWRGASTAAPATASMNTALDHISDFNIEDDITFNADSMITLAE